MKTGIERISQERKRQIEKEGWTSDHDASHTAGELSLAARAYTDCAVRQLKGHGQTVEPPFDWPWGREWFKPSDNPIRNLEKAGALIAAEIDRIAALAPADKTEEQNEPTPPEL